MRYQKVLVTCLAILSGLLVSHLGFAADLKITTEKDPYAVFYPAKTFGWHPLSAAYKEWDKPIRASVERELTSRGFKKANAGSPDFWIGYQFHKLDKTKRVLSGHAREDYSWDEKKVRKGTFRLDIFSPDRRRIIFRGWSESAYDSEVSDKKKMEMTNQAVKRIISQLPPPG